MGSLSKRRVMLILSTTLAALQRFAASRAPAGNQNQPRWISKEEIIVIAEAGGTLLRSAKESPFPYVQEWVTAHQEEWTAWQKQIKCEMQKIGASSTASGSSSWLDLQS